MTWKKKVILLSCKRGPTMVTLKDKVILFRNRETIFMTWTDKVTLSTFCLIRRLVQFHCAKCCNDNNLRCKFLEVCVLHFKISTGHI